MTTGNMPQACPGVAVSPISSLTDSGLRPARLQVDCPSNERGQPKNFNLPAIAGQSDVQVFQVAFRGARIAADFFWTRDQLDHLLPATRSAGELALIELRLVPKQVCSTQLGSHTPAERVPLSQQRSGSPQRAQQADVGKSLDLRGHYDGFLLPTFGSVPARSLAMLARWRNNTSAASAIRTGTKAV